MKLYENLYKKLNIEADSIALDLLEPPKDYNKLHQNAYSEDAIQQCDLLYLPNDNGFKYVVVCVDVATRKMDCEAVKDRKPETILKTLKKIWKRKYVNRPDFFFKTDDGSEFKGALSRYLFKTGIVHLIGKPGRSRSQAIVEAMNKMIGKALAVKFRNDEISTGNEQDEWVKDLPKIVEVYNKFNKEKTKKRRVSNKDKIYKNFNPTLPDNLYKKGDLVHIPLDKPTNFQGKRLSGKFRAGDLRYEVKPRKITNVMVSDPTVYKVEGLPTTVYTYEMLIPFIKKKKPKPTEKKFNVEKLVKREKKNGRIKFYVKWEGYPSSQNTWENRSELIKQIPEIVKEYEKKNK